MFCCPQIQRKQHAIANSITCIRHRVLGNLDFTRLVKSGKAGISTPCDTYQELVHWVQLGMGPHALQQKQRLVWLQNSGRKVYTGDDYRGSQRPVKLANPSLLESDSYVL